MNLLVFLVGFLVVLVLSILGGFFFINYLRKNEIIQPIYEDALENHKAKGGTPTMGGITFLVPVLILIIATSIFNMALAIIMLIIIAGYGYIGFADDRLKVFNKANQSGLSPKQKLIYQFIMSIFLIIFLYATGVDTTIDFIFFSINFGILYYILMPIMIVAYSNATNLVDGLDGLLSSVSIISFLSLAIIAVSQGQAYIALILFGFIGGLCAFLFGFNKNPAKMFMGDTGSLAIGAFFALAVALLKIEFIGIIIGLVYVIEVLSVTLQVSYFKYTKKKYGEGRRIFKMAPLHHHFEKDGMGEKKIVLLFTIVQIICSIVGLLLYFSF